MSTEYNIKKAYSESYYFFNQNEKLTLTLVTDFLVQGKLQKALDLSLNTISFKNKKMKMMTSEKISILKRVLTYILPTLLFFSWIGFYLTKKTSSEEAVYFHLDILENNRSKVISYSSFFGVFKDSYSSHIPFGSTYKAKEIGYIKSLNDKCLNSKALTQDEKSLLRDYLWNIQLSHKPLGYTYNAEADILKSTGVAFSVILLIVLYLLTKRIKREKIRKPVRYYLILIFLVNYFFAFSNKENLYSLEKKLFECSQFFL